MSGTFLADYILTQRGPTTEATEFTEKSDLLLSETSVRSVVNSFFF
jgi:hypothetical protein